MKIMISVRKLNEYIGAEVLDVDLRDQLTDKMTAELKKLWLDHLVFLFRNQSLSQNDLLRVTQYFGSLGNVARPKEFRPSGYDRLEEGIMLISNVRENGVPIGALPDGEMHFHHDMLHAEIPHKGTILYSLEVPSHGGNTLFANCYTAYEKMPAALRDRLEGRKAFHHFNYGSVKREDGKGVAAFAESIHPVFRTHEETKRKAVYVNRLMTAKVVDMPEEEGKSLLNQVFDHSENPAWIYEHVWRPGDVLLWDNRCSMHARTDFPEGQRRLMLRTTIEGEARPV
jgi:taurine dioxygenase